MIKILCTISVLLIGFTGFAQVQPTKKKAPVLSDQNSTSNPNTNPNSNDQAQQSVAPRKDSIGFERRNDAKDSINITYRYLDSLRRNNLDSSINDFSRYYVVPSDYQYLGNNGAAAFPLIFKPYLKAGFDPGFHAFDVYKFTFENTKFYKTNRPFSMLSYQLASGKEQMLKAGHTQNPSPRINVGFDYRLITAPGFFVTQNTNHNSYRLFGSFQGKRKRYQASTIMVGNNIRASENGGIQNDTLLADPNRKDRFSVPVNMGNSAEYRRNPFVTTVSTGNTYKDFNFFLRQSYDLGKRDSVAINDSTTEYLFYPKLRIQHTLTTSNNRYRFSDVIADSSLYQDWYRITLRDSIDSFKVEENWTIISNDFSLYQFPDTKNPSQFLMAGITLQNMKASNAAGDEKFYNLFLHGEYRNRTRNKKWDILLKGELYANGLNNGDYLVQANLERYLGKKWGTLKLFFYNVNRTPSFVFDNRSAFHLGVDNNFNKENTISFGAAASNSWIDLSFQNHLISNYTYFENYVDAAQYSKVINVLQGSASKKIRLAKRWSWYAELALQVTDQAAPVRVPLVYTRNRIAYEGRFFKNLYLHTGVELRYYSSYNANNYSPVTGQFTQQNEVLIKNRPDIHAFLHFRIRGFAGFLRAENLNTMSFENGFGFVKNNFAAPHYPTQGFIFRFGIQWWFVN